MIFTDKINMYKKQLSKRFYLNVDWIAQICKHVGGMSDEVFLLLIKAKEPMNADLMSFRFYIPFR